MALEGSVGLWGLGWTCGRAGFSHASLGCPSAAASTARSVRREARSLDSLPCSCSTANRTASIDSCSATRSVLPAAARRAWRAWRVRRCRHIRRQRCRIGAPQSCPRTRHDESKHGDIFPAWQRRAARITSIVRASESSARSCRCRFASWMHV